MRQQSSVGRWGFPSTRSCHRSRRHFLSLSETATRSFPATVSFSPFMVPTRQCRGMRRMTMTDEPGVVDVTPTTPVEKRAERALSDIVRGLVEQMNERKADRQRMVWVTDDSYGESCAGVTVTLIISRSGDVAQPEVYTPEQDNDRGQ